MGWSPRGCAELPQAEAARRLENGPFPAAMVAIPASRYGCGLVGLRGPRMIPSTLVHDLTADGFVHLHDVTQADLVDVLESLGRTIYVEEVRATPGAASLVKSRSGIDWHTDHHRAERIVWYCLADAEVGGDTLVADGLRALALLNASQVEALRRVALTDHSVFRGDPPRHAMLIPADTEDGRPRLYFSLWLADETTGVERAAFEAFGEALAKVEHHRFRLQPGDVLAIDNTRMAHARTPIGGKRVRHLRRYWLAAT